MRGRNWAAADSQERSNGRLFRSLTAPLLEVDAEPEVVLDLDARLLQLPCGAALAENPTGVGRRRTPSRTIHVRV